MPKFQLDSIPKADNNDLGWPWDKQTETTASDSLPKISIVTVSLNRVNLIEKAIRSVLLQNYPNLEYIIIDGGSTDGTLEIIEKYKPWISYFISEPDRGISNAINKGLSKATGEVLTWLNSDDYYLPGALLAVAKTFAQGNTHVVVGKGRFQDVSGKIFEDANPKHQNFDYDSLLDWERNYFVQPSCFFSKEAWDSCGPLDEDLDYCMDVDLFLDFAKNYQYRSIDEILSIFLVHDGSRSSGTGALYKSYVELNILLVKKFGNVAIPKRHMMNAATRMTELEAALEDRRKALERADSMLNARLIDLLRYRWNAWKQRRTSQQARGS